MKICSLCSQSLLFKDFDFYFDRNNKGRKTNVLKPFCRVCEKDYNKNLRDKMRQLISRWKLSKGCQRYGFKASYGFQLELDHVHREFKKKRKGTYRAIEPTWSKDRVKNELSMCQVLCKNCHALKTYYETRDEEMPKLPTKKA